MRQKLIVTFIFLMLLSSTSLATSQWYWITSDAAESMFFDKGRVNTYYAGPYLIRADAYVKTTLADLGKSDLLKTHVAPDDILYNTSYYVTYNHYDFQANVMATTDMYFYSSDDRCLLHQHYPNAEFRGMDPLQSYEAFVIKSCFSERK